MIGLQKKDGGIMPIAVGYTLRCLSAKYTNFFIIKKKSDELQTIQADASMSGGAEAAIHAVCRLAEHLPDEHVIVKLDFTNTFSSVRRDTILISVADKMLELYRIVHASLDCRPKLSYGDDIIVSA